MPSQPTDAGLKRAATDRGLHFIASTAERVARCIRWLYAHRSWVYALAAFTVVGGVIALLFVDTVADFYQGLGFHTMYSRRKAANDITLVVWIVIGYAIAVGVSIPVGAALVRVGTPIALRLWHSTSERRAKQTTPPATSIGTTIAGQPIYPVVGCTYDGQPVTADRAAGVRGKTTGTNGMAIAALILAVTIAPVGLILGFIARAQINKSGQEGSGLALAAIIVGGVFTAINTAMFVALAAATGL